MNTKYSIETYEFCKKYGNIPDLQFNDNDIDRVKIINCRNQQLTTIPALPKNLKELYCHYNPLTSLPVIPESLENLSFSIKHIKHLKSVCKLPDSIKILNIL